MIDKNIIKKQFNIKKFTDYTYSIVFFITFSFFAFVVIRPNILMIFNLQKELAELQIIDESYNGVIDKIIKIQTSLEEIRDVSGVLDESFPTKPNVNQLVDDIKKVSSDSGVSIDKLSISEINLKNKTDPTGYRKVKIDFSTEDGFENVYKLIKNLTNQRRLKEISNISFKKITKESSSSANVNLQLLIEGYYL